MAGSAAGSWIDSDGNSHTSNGMFWDTVISPEGKDITVVWNKKQEASGDFQPEGGLLPSEPIVVTPMPPPAPTKPITPVAFEVNPHMEKKTVDPYKTVPLGELTKAELSIDNSVSYLDKVVPKELQDEFKNSPNLLATLAAKGQSLQQYMRNLRSQLPSNTNLTGLLRQVGLPDTVANLPSLLASIKSQGMTLMNLPSAFIGDSLSFMAEMKAMGDTSRYLNEFQSMTDFSSVFSGMGNLNGQLSSLGSSLGFGGQSMSSAYNPVADTAIALSSMNVMVDARPSDTSLLASADIQDADLFLQYIDKLQANEFSVVTSSVQAVGTETAKGLTTVLGTKPVSEVKDIVTTLSTADNFSTLNTVATLDVRMGSETTTQLIAAINSYPEETTTAVELVKTYDNTSLKDLQTTLGAIGQTKTEAIIALVAAPTITIDLETTLAVLLEIKTIGLEAYIATHTVGPYGELFTKITEEGIDIVLSVVKATAAIGKASINTVLTTVGTVRATVLDTSIAANATVMKSSLSEIVAKLIKDTPTSVTAAVTQVETIGPKLARDVMDALVKMNVKDLITFIETIPAVDTAILVANINTINGLSSTNILAIATHIATSNPYTVLEKANLAGTFLYYAVKKACELNAQKGNYKMVLKLLASYPGTITKDYRRYLVATLLSNYKPTVDSTVLGLNVTAKSFGDALFLIHEDWDTIIRNDAFIANLSAFLTASKSALELLKRYARTEVNAILQFDNNYSLV